VLELVEDADLFRGRSAVGCCALGARSSWLVGIRFEGKSGHLEHVDMTEGIREVLPLAAGCTTGLQKEMAETGKSTGSCRLLALPSQNRNTPYGPPWHAMPCHAILSRFLTPSP
jgi:hypothetical protein